MLCAETSLEGCHQKKIKKLNVAHSCSQKNAYGISDKLSVTIMMSGADTGFRKGGGGLGNC